MELGTKEWNAAIAVGSALLSFLLSWAWGRFWKKKDSATDEARQKQDLAGAKVGALEVRIVAVEAREVDRARLIGSLETNQNRLEGKIEGLQTFWRTEFAKLTEQFKTFEEKVEFRLDNFRLELRGDQQKTEDRLTELLTGYQAREAAERAAHQGRIHDRLNVIAADQARMLSEFVDQLVDKKAGD